MEKKKAGTSGIHLSRLNVAMIVIAVIASFFLLWATAQSITGYQTMLSDTDRYISALQAASDMQEASDYLTAQARVFTITGDRTRVDNFFYEMEVTRRRDLAVEDLRSISGEENAMTYLDQALAASNALVQVEFHSMRLKIASLGDDLTAYPPALQAYALTAEEAAMTPEQQLALSQELVFGDAYQEAKDAIINYVHLCTGSLIENTYMLQASSSEELLQLLQRQQILTIVLLLTVLLVCGLCAFLIIRPLQKSISSIQTDKPMPLSGSYEVRFLAESYNDMFDRTRRTQDKLSYEATHDPLTGIYNRKAYETVYAEADKSNMALIIVDVDDFKGINDTYGHAVGDEVLKKVAHSLRDCFRSEDYICRIGGDEFVVLMVHADSSLSELVYGKIQRVNEKLQQTEGDIPKVTLSVGVAFADRARPHGDLFSAADTALYRVKNRGRNGCEIY